MYNIELINKFQYQYQQNRSNFLTLWVSISIYSISYLLLSIEQINGKLCILGMSLGIIGIIFSVIKLIQFKIANKYLRFIFILYMGRQLYITLWGLSNFNYLQLMRFIKDPDLFFAYLVPLILLIPANIFFIRKMIDFFTYLGISLFLFFPLFASEILYTNMNLSELTLWTLGTGCGFIVLTWSYHTKKRKILAFSVVLFSLFIATVMARRNIMLTFGNYIVFSILIILFSSKLSIKLKISIIFLVLVSSFAGYYIFNTYQDIFFNKITDRIEDNTREGLYDIFMDDMSTNDLIFGKGFSGTYYAPGIEEDIDNRDVVECGYLQTILNGGIINLSLFLLITIPAVYLGFFKSNNILSRSAGAIVLLWLIDMFPWGMASLNIRYVLLWICIGICYSKEIRYLSEKALQNSLINKLR